MSSRGQKCDVIKNFVVATLDIYWRYEEIEVDLDGIRISHGEKK
jgi:hypothetical protein